MMNLIIQPYYLINWIQTGTENGKQTKDASNQKKNIEIIEMEQLTMFYVVNTKLLYWKQFITI